MGLETSLPLLPLTIFVAEVCVVTVSTIRIIVMARGQKMVAVCLGAIEITLWLFAMRQIMTNLADPACYLAFAGGFTLGNFLGITIEEKMALGSVVVRVVTRRDAGELIESLRQANYGVTSIDARGATGPVRIVFTVVKRKQLRDVASLIQRFDPRAFYSVDNLRSTSEGVFPLGRIRNREPVVLDLQRAA